MGDKNENLPVAIREDGIRQLICIFRDIQVMVDADLAVLYGVETKVLNQAVKRNIARFPVTFRFQLSEAEKEELVTNCDRFKNLKHSSTLPYAFTEQGVAMLSAVLRSETAIQTSIHIINAFVGMRRLLAANGGLLQRMDSLEKRQSSRVGTFVVPTRHSVPMARGHKTNAHPTGLIMDNEAVYHLGASLKDLGKKWFAFSKMDKSGLKVMERIQEVVGYGGKPWAK